jgi:hypothetical protein
LKSRRVDLITCGSADDVNVTKQTDLPEAQLADAEADVYWCLTRLIDKIQVRMEREFSQRNECEDMC